MSQYNKLHTGGVLGLLIRPACHDSPVAGGLARRLLLASFFTAMRLIRLVAVISPKFPN